MNKPHKHAALIKAWADGAEIECKLMHKHHTWSYTAHPQWDCGNYTFRIKPEPTYEPNPGDLVLVSDSGNSDEAWYTREYHSMDGNMYQCAESRREPFSLCTYVWRFCKPHPKQLLIDKQAKLIKEHEEAIDKIYEYFFNERGM